MITKACPNCKTEQLWDVLFGYENRFCPDFCDCSFLQKALLNNYELESSQDNNEDNKS